MTLIKLNDGESITVQMNHDKSKLPYSILIRRIGKFMSYREFGDSKEGIFDASSTKEVIK